MAKLGTLRMVGPPADPDIRARAVGAGAAVGVRRRHVARVLRAHAGRLYRLAEAARLARARTLARLVGAGAGDLRLAAVLCRHHGGRAVPGADRLRAFPHRSGLASGGPALSARAGVPAVPAVFHGSDPLPGLCPHHAAAAVAGQPRRGDRAGTDGHTGAAARQRAGTGAADTLGSGGVQRHPLPAFTHLPGADLRVLFRAARLAAGGAVRGHGSDRDCGECQPRDPDRGAGPVPPRAGRRLLPHGFGLGDFHGGAGDSGRLSQGAEQDSRCPAFTASSSP
jgi:hypothetical protein